MKTSHNIISQTVRLLDASAPWLAFLLIRLLIGWEFLESGLVKLNGENWFSHIKDDFLFPFNMIPVDISWFIATWLEIIGGIAMMLGIGTRFFAITLMVLTIVAMVAVHWPAEIVMLSDLLKGYAITDNGYGNFKLPLLFLAMLIPLVFAGAGKSSVDFWLKMHIEKRVKSRGAEYVAA